MKKHKKGLLKLMVLTLTVCMLSACGQSAESSGKGGYTIDNIREQVVGLNEEMELESGQKKAVTNFDNAATTPALQPVMDEVDEQLKSMVC
jgi:hypothetical protein